jgi:hypothetical protein
VMGAAGRQFGAPARSLPTRTARLPLMRLCVHATTIPTSEPRPREQVETPERDRARTAGREGDLKGTSNKPDAKDLEGTRDRPRGETTGTIMRGAVCPGSEDGGQASAAGTSRHELGDCKESQRMGARTAI